MKNCLFTQSEPEKAMTHEERARALERCDQEIARIHQEGETDQHPAWLITLGAEDWEAEKRMILKEEDSYSLTKHEPCPSIPSDPPVVEGAVSVESQRLEVACGRASGAQTARG